MTDKIERLAKIVMIGESGVGKTCLVKRLTEKPIAFEHLPTIAVDLASKTIEIEEAIVRLLIWDTAGQESFHSLTGSYYRGWMIIRTWDYNLLCNNRPEFFRSAKKMDRAN